MRDRTIFGRRFRAALDAALAQRGCTQQQLGAEIARDLHRRRRDETHEQDQRRLEQEQGRWAKNLSRWRNSDSLPATPGELTAVLAAIASPIPADQWKQWWHQARGDLAPTSDTVSVPRDLAASRDPAPYRAKIRAIHALAVPRRVRKAGAALAALAGCVLMLSPPLPAAVTAARYADGDVAILYEGGAPLLVFATADGGIASCGRAEGENWAGSWPYYTASTERREISDTAVFHSDFDGIEMLGNNDGTLVFGYRDNGLTAGRLSWHAPEPVLDARGAPAVRAVTGRPGFLQLVPVGDADPIFAALVPVRSGGLAVLARDGIGPSWTQLGVVAPELGMIDSVALAHRPGAGLFMILRVGSMLWQMTRPDPTTSAGLTSGWSDPQPIMPASTGLLDVAGDPVLVSSDPVGVAFWLAVPVTNGLMLLSTMDGLTGIWSAEKVPDAPAPDALGLLEGYEDAGSNVVAVYRQGERLYSVWRGPDRRWHGPSPVRCGPNADVNR